jgi:hypothetical protein
MRCLSCLAALLALPLLLCACRPPAEPIEQVDLGNQAFAEFDKVPKPGPGQDRLRKPWEPERGLTANDLAALEQDLACIRAFYENKPGRYELALPLVYDHYNTDAATVATARTALAADSEKQASLGEVKADTPLCRGGKPTPAVRAAVGEPYQDLPPEERGAKPEEPSRDLVEKDRVDAERADKQRIDDERSAKPDAADPNVSPEYLEEKRRIDGDKEPESKPGEDAG